MSPDWKVTALYDQDTDNYLVTVWLWDESAATAASWRPVAYVEQPRLEAHQSLFECIRFALRALGRPEGCRLIAVPMDMGRKPPAHPSSTLVDPE